MTSREIQADLLLTFFEQNRDVTRPKPKLVVRTGKDGLFQIRGVVFSTTPVPSYSIDAVHVSKDDLKALEEEGYACVLVSRATAEQRFSWFALVADES